MPSRESDGKGVSVTERSSRAFQLIVMFIIAAWVVVCIAYILILGWAANISTPSSCVIGILNVSIANWLLWVGGSLGGFWYLIVLRVHGGKTIGGRSKCPGCGTAIRFSDILPVLGWLRLDGCCRACRLSISTSYPIAELTFAVFALVVGLMQITWRCFENDGSFDMLTAVWILRVKSIDTAIFASSIFAFAISLTLVRGVLIFRENGHQQR